MIQNEKVVWLTVVLPVGLGLALALWGGVALGEARAHSQAAGNSTEMVNLCRGMMNSGNMTGNMMGMMGNGAGGMMGGGNMTGDMMGGNTTGAMGAGSMGGMGSGAG